MKTPTRTEPILDVAHLGHVELLTPKPAESVWYFTEALGMEKVHEEGGSAYLRGYGDYATTTLKLTESKQAGAGTIAWRAMSENALERRGAGVYWGSALPESFLKYVTPNATGAEVPVSRFKGPIFDPQ